MKAKYKKYLTNPESMPIEIRYKSVYNLVKNVLYIKHYKISSSGLNDLPLNPGLYVVNHKSNMDPLVIFKLLYENTKIPYFRFIAKAELDSKSYLSYAFKLVDTIFINRENVRDTYNKFKEEINLNDDKRSIVIFPEGTRVIDPEKMIEFHEGSFRIAYKYLAPIIPTVIVGSIVYFVIRAVALEFDIDPSYMKLISAVIVALALAVPKFIEDFRNKRLYTPDDVEDTDSTGKEEA